MVEWLMECPGNIVVAPSMGDQVSLLVGIRCNCQAPATDGISQGCCVLCRCYCWEELKHCHTAERLFRCGTQPGEWRLDS